MKDDRSGTSTPDTTVGAAPSLKAAVTVQEVAPGEFVYWIVRLKSGPTARYAEHSQQRYSTADAAWAAGVQECKRVLGKPE